MGMTEVKVFRYGTKQSSGDNVTYDSMCHQLNALSCLHLKLF